MPDTYSYARRKQKGVDMAIEKLRRVVLLKDADGDDRIMRALIELVTWRKEQHHD